MSYEKSATIHLMARTKQRRQLLTFLAGTLALTAFLILSSVALVWANGLRFDPTTWNFEKTVLIAVEGDLDDITVSVNNEPASTKIPLRLRNLLPGRYQVEIAKNGYQSWIETFWLSAGQVGLIEDPVLIAVNPLITESKEVLTIRERLPFDQGITLENGELRDRGTLITRLTSNPLQVHRLQRAYIYQSGSELRIIFAKSGVDFFVATLPSAELMPLALFPGTWQVAFTENGSTKLINLTLPANLNTTTVE